MNLFEGRGSGPVLEQVLRMLDQLDSQDVAGSLHPRRSGEGAPRVRKPRSPKSK